MDQNPPNPQAPVMPPLTSFDQTPQVGQTPAGSGQSFPTAPPVENTPPPPPAGSAPSIPPELLPEKKTSPVLIVGIILLVIGILAIVAYVFGSKFLGSKNMPTPTPMPTIEEEPTPTPTPDPTLGWKSYTHTKLGFSVKHPAGWTVKEDPRYALFDTLVKNEIKNTNYMLQISTLTRVPTTEKLGSITIGVYTFDKYMTEGATPSMDYTLKSGEKIFKFSVYPYDSVTFPTTLTTDVELVLSTFKVVTPTPSASPSGSPRASATPTATASATPTATP